MARDRSRGPAARARADAADGAAGLRREARGWFIRAAFALVAAGLATLLSVVLALLVALVAVWCLAQGVRRAVAAAELEG